MTATRAIAGVGNCCVKYTTVFNWVSLLSLAPALLLMQANRAHTYLGKREAEWHDTHNEEDIYPDFPTMAKSFGVPAKRVIKKSELRAGEQGAVGVG